MVFLIFWISLPLSAVLSMTVGIFTSLFHDILQRELDVYRPSIALDSIVSRRVRKILLTFSPFSYSFSVASSVRYVVLASMKAKTLTLGVI